MEARKRGSGSSHSTASQSFAALREHRAELEVQHLADAEQRVEHRRLDVPGVEQLRLREGEVGGRRPAARRPGVDARGARRRARVLGAHVRAVAEVLAHLPELQRQVAQRVAPLAPLLRHVRLQRVVRRQRVVDVAVDQRLVPPPGGASQRPSAPPETVQLPRVARQDRAQLRPVRQRRDRVGRLSHCQCGWSVAKHSSSSRADLVEHAARTPRRRSARRRAASSAARARAGRRTAPGASTGSRAAARATGGRSATGTTGSQAKPDSTQMTRSSG